MSRSRRVLRLMDQGVQTMDGILFGMAILVSSSAGLPAVEMPRVAPSAFTFNLPDAAATSLREQSRPVWQRTSSRARAGHDGEAVQHNPQGHCGRRRRGHRIPGGRAGRLGGYAEAGTVRRHKRSERGHDRGADRCSAWRGARLASDEINSLLTAARLAHGRRCNSSKNVSAQ